MNDKTNCKTVMKLLEQFLDGELSAQQEDWVKDELGRCQDCRTKYERLQKLRVLIREVYVEEARTAELQDILPGVLGKLENRTPSPWERVGDWLEKYKLGLASPVAPLGVAATVAVAIIAATLIYVSSNVPSATNGLSTSPALAEQSEESPHGETKLADRGSSDKEAMDRKVADAGADGTHRRPRHDERPYKTNECFITYYKVTSGTVIVDVDPDGDAPTVVWHLPDTDAAAEENNRI